MLTRTLKVKAVHQEVAKNVSQGLISTVLIENVDVGEQDVMMASPSRSKSPMVEKSKLDNVRMSLKEEITFDVNKNPDRLIPKGIPKIPKISKTQRYNRKH